MLDWLAKDAGYGPDWTDACLVVLSGRDKELPGLDLRSGVPDDTAPAGRDGHSIGGETGMTANLALSQAPTATGRRVLH